MTGIIRTATTFIAWRLISAKAGTCCPPLTSQWPLADELRDNYAGIEHTVRLSREERRLYSHDDKSFYENLFYIADSTVFDVFTYTIVAGDAGTALDEPFNIVLTRSIAIKYFGTVDVLGETLQDQKGTTFKVTAVIEDVPRNSHLRFRCADLRAELPGALGFVDQFWDIYVCAA